MKALVTGGAGYKGILLTEALLEAGYQVTVVDNFLYGAEPLLHLAGNRKLTVVNRDVRNDLGEYLSDKDVIFHLAGISGYPACEANPHSAKLINVDATRNLVNKLSKDQLLVYASTTSIYGRSGERRNEESAVEPVSTYGVTKLQAEEICLEHEFTIAPRFPTLFGISPRMRIDLLCNDFTYRALNERCVVVYSGQSKRTFLHVRDAIGGYMFALENAEAMKGGVYNVGSDSLNYTKLSLLDIVKKKIDFEIIDAEIEDPDVRNYEIDYSKIGKLGYKVKYSMEDGIDELLHLYAFYKPTKLFNTI